MSSSDNNSIGTEAETDGGTHDELDDDKRDFDLLKRRRTISASSKNSSPLSDSPSIVYDNDLSRVGTNDMIWPLHLTPTFVEHYIIGDVIGNGSYAEVRECVDTRTLERCALKIVNKSYLRRQAPRALANQLQEIRLLRHLVHVNVISMRECLFKGDRIYIALEHCSFNLDELLNDQPGGSFKVNIARSFFLQLCSAVSYLHSIGIVHRDIKPQNMLLTNGGTLKLIDYGVSQILYLWQREDLCSNYEGSPLFQAPEVVSGQKEYHGFKVDIWSCGVTLYLMLYGRYPFMDEALLGLYDKILAQDLEIPATLSNGESMNQKAITTSLALTDLLAMMLEKESSRRASIAQVLDSPWCKLVANTNDCDDLEFWRSEFFDLVVRQSNDNVGRKPPSETYATSQPKDMYKSMNCLPYLYRHHFPHLPIKKTSTGRGGSSSDRGTFTERINSMSSSSENLDSRSARSSSVSSGSPANNNDEWQTKSRDADVSSDDAISASEDTTSEVEWGTREQYELIKMPQVRANRIRCGASSKLRTRKRRPRKGRE